MSAGRTSVEVAATGRAYGESAPAVAAGGRYAAYVLAVLFLVYAVNFVDRNILSILAQEIKASLKVSDAQLGFLYGTAFAIFYAVFGIALARLADGWYRVRLIALGLTLWSGMTALSGLAGSFGQLAAARVGVGIGEASASPAAYSLLADYFPSRQRASALAIYSAGLYVGAGLSLPLGGALSHGWNRRFAAGGAPFGLAGWQAAFLVAGIAGLALALWVVSLREPPRGLSEGQSAPARQPGIWGAFGRELAGILPPFTLWRAAQVPGGIAVNVALLLLIAALATLLVWVTGDRPQWIGLAVGCYAAASWAQQLRARDRPAFALLWGSPTVVFALIGSALLAFVSYGISFWAPPYAIRTFHVGADVAGWLIGIPAALASAAGCVLGGRLSDFWKQRDPRGRIYVCLLAVVLPVPVTWAALSTSEPRVFYVLVPFTVALANLWLGSSAAIVQDCVLPRMRATAGAAFLLMLSLLGLALGPYLAGKVSVVSGSLRTGILSLFLACPVAFYVLWRSGRGLAEAEASKEIRARAAGEAAAPA
ncbi:MAG TPA: MFS transporter [Steroidobacteraceae bacterium]|nr:MFS transporter [Steroidobacteraceae bacterium]